MPPKKVVQEEKIPLGRPGNNLKSGIVRLPVLGTAGDWYSSVARLLTISS